MQSGSWSLRLMPDTPYSVRAALDVLGHVFVLPTPVDVRTTSDANMKAIARYVGVVRKKASPFDLEGPGIAWWLGSEDGVGDLVYPAVAKTVGTMSAWITDVLPSAVAAGTLTNTGLSTLTWTTPQWATPRQCIDYICANTGAWWRMRNDFTLDAAAPATIFARTPTSIVVRRDGGPDLLYPGLLATSLVAGEDATDLNTEVRVIAEGEGGTIATDIYAGAAPGYKDGRGNNVVLQRLVSSPSTGYADIIPLATAIYNQNATTKKAVSLSTATHDVGRYVKPGDALYVYDPDMGMTDTANQVPYRGELLPAKAVTVFAITWPVESGMGVYYRDKDGAYTDLTQWVDWEAGDVNYEIGVQANGYLTTGELFNVTPGGVNAEALERLSRNRVGCSLRRAANQQINTGVQATITWDTEDQDTHGFIAVSGTTVTIPTGYDGLYVASARIQSDAGVTAGAVYLFMQGEVYGVPWIAGGSYAAVCSGAYPLAAGNTISVQVYNGSAGNRQYTGRLTVYKVSP